MGRRRARAPESEAGDQRFDEVTPDRGGDSEQGNHGEGPKSREAKVEMEECESRGESQHPPHGQAEGKEAEEEHPNDIDRSHQHRRVERSVPRASMPLAVAHVAQQLDREADDECLPEQGSDESYGVHEPTVAETVARTQCSAADRQIDRLGLDGYTAAPPALAP